jgi:FlgD Ig-like domain
MRTKIFTLGILICCLMLGAAQGSAQTDSTAASFYKLEPPSSFETGCFAICECPIFTHALQGTFDLRPVGSDPLFDYYRVENVRWSVTDATTNLGITGAGTYRVGGEFAVQQQMTLDLSIGGAAPRRFDSGLVLGGGEFPRIKIDISLHQNTACVDTLMHIEAIDPVVTAVDGAFNTRMILSQAAPNPFHQATQVRLYLPRSTPLEVNIYDLHGRLVRHLVDESPASAGAHVLTWDGRADLGASCAAGVYFLEARPGQGRMVTRIVKLK